jgi:signal transduction histidine kinase
VELTLQDRVRRSAGPGLVLRALPSALVVFTVVTNDGERRLPFTLIVVLAAIVVLSNGWLLLLQDGEPIGRAVIALLAFASAGSLLWFALPGSALIALPYWVARVAVRYHRPGPAEWVVVGIATAGATVPFYLASHSLGVAFGVVFGMTALVLASTNRRNRQDQLEELEVSLARKQTALEEHGRAAALAERARIARDVHDVLAHSLASRPTDWPRHAVRSPHCATTRSRTKERSPTSSRRTGSRAVQPQPSKPPVRRGSCGLT